MLNMALHAPMPSARDRTATAVNAGVRASIRQAGGLPGAFDGGFDQPVAARVAIVFFHLADAAELHASPADGLVARDTGRTCFST
jgi:hypothetical protein